MAAPKQNPRHKQTPSLKQLQKQKQTKPASSAPFNKGVLYNVGGAILLASVVVAAMNSSFSAPPETPLCETRYDAGVLFSLARQNGKPLAAEELQARLNGLDRGLVKNARIVKDEGVPYGHALEVQLRQAKPDEDDQSRSGIGFAWMPRQLVTATAACLSYSVWTPEDFKPGDGGVLPGLASDTSLDEALAPEPPPSTSGNGNGNEQQAEPAPTRTRPFASRLQWRADGSLVLQQLPNIGHRGMVLLDPTKAALRPGRWVRIEQEMVLNAPGSNNGVLRVWIDGKLVHERFDLGYRTDELQSFQAVIGDVHNERHGAWAPAPVDTRIRLSPLELRVK